MNNEEVKLDFDQETPKINYREYLFRYLRLWPLLIVSTVLCLLFAFLYLKISTKQYHINAKLLIQSEKNSSGQGGGGIMDLNSLLGGKSNVDNEVEVLKTRYLMDRLVRDQNLNIVWYTKDFFSNQELNREPFLVDVVSTVDTIYSTEFEFNVVDKNSFSLDYIDPIDETEISDTIQFNKEFELKRFGRFKVSRSPTITAIEDQTYILAIKSVDSRISELRNSLNILVPNKLASTIDIQFDYPLTAKGEKILANYINEYIRQNIQDKSRIADSTIAFIDERILLVNAELNGIEGSIQSFMQSSGLANISEQSKLLITNSSQYVKDLADIDSKIQVVEALEDFLGGEGTRKVVSASVLPDDAGFSELLTRYNSLNLERERLLLSYTPDNPYVSNTDRRIESVRQDIIAYLANTKKNLQVSRSAIRKNAGKLEGNIREVPAQERQFLDLSRQQQLKQELYLYLLQKREETAVAKTSNIAGIRIIDPPKADAGPFTPRKLLICGGALFLALIIPLGVIYAQDLLNTKVLNRKDVERRTQLPIVGEFSHNSSASELVEFKSSRTAIAEQFRALRTNLQFLMSSTSDKVILITSGMPGEGKSFTSLNLANIYAVSGKKVLLLEFDLRKPKLSKTYKGFSNIGISNYIVDSSLALDDVINPVGDNGSLYFAACGPIPPNPAELILNERVSLLIAEARKKFDLVIIDAPPLGAVTDGQLLSKHADVTLHIVRAGYTPHELLGLPEDIRREGKIKNMAIVLNDVDENTGGYYGYNYGYYSSEENTKKTWWNKRN